MVPAGVNPANDCRCPITSDFWNISLLALPPYAPELNPVENIWQFLRHNFLSHQVWNTYDDILAACRDTWNKLMQMPERIASIAQHKWIQTVIG